MTTALVDAVEICCHSKGNLTEKTWRTGVTTERICIENGYNISVDSGFDKASSLMSRLRPRRACLSLPCTLWMAPGNADQPVGKVLQLPKARQRGRRRISICLQLFLHVSQKPKQWLYCKLCGAIWVAQTTVLIYVV